MGVIQRFKPQISINAKRVKTLAKVFILYHSIQCSNPQNLVFWGFVLF